MSLNRFKAVSLKDKLDAQEEVLAQEAAAVASELEAVKEAKKRAVKEDMEPKGHNKVKQDA